jgi:hypothetical protein
VALTGSAAQNRYDTLYTRGNGYLLVEKYDTLEQLEIAEKKLDSILLDLQLIAKELGIKDTIK